MTIPAGGEGKVEAKVAVPQQAPASSYAGLVQVAGLRAVRAVISLDVL
jgi:hypothetical protein